MSLNATNLYIQASPIPATFKGTPNDLFAEMIKRMRILSPSGTNFIFIGDSEPSSNVGPWLKNGTQWYVWDTSTKRYVPQDISASFTPAFWIGNAVPTSINLTVWLQTTLNPSSSNPLDYGDPIRWFTWNGQSREPPVPVAPARRAGPGELPGAGRAERVRQVQFPDVVGFIGDLLRVGPLRAIRGDERAGVPPRTSDPANLIWMRQGEEFELAVELLIPPERSDKVNGGKYKRAR